ncbi:MAG: Flp pilus assembly complex ATPase component TadA [Clostridiales bacterium]|nr:Flp pilus assembly complex ATPase component TadA [Clostridiales bacterium]
MILNTIIILLIFLGFGSFLFFFFSKGKNVVVETGKMEYSIDWLAEQVRNDFDQSLRVDIREMNLNMVESLKVERQRKKLKKAYKDCPLGDKGDKNYVKDYIRNLLQSKYQVSEENIDRWIDFNNIKKLDNTIKFLLLLNEYKKTYGYDALKEIILQNNLDVLRRDGQEEGYYIDEKDLNRLLFEKKINLDFYGKLEILTQLIYQKNNGNGVVDEVLDMNVDGVSGGESGIPEWALDDSVSSVLSHNLVYSYDSIWIFFQAKKIHLRFLSFGSEKELERICKNVYQYDYPGQLSASNGYKINQMKNGSRVTVLRPNLTESWVFIIRKFDNVVAKEINEVTKNKTISDILISLVKGCQVIAVTGQQGTGKTTLLKSLIGYINSNFPLRIQELEFELWVRKLYVNRSIITFRETDITKGEEALEIIRKSDGGVTIFGEVVSPIVAAWLVATAHVATRMTMFTHHADSTKVLVNTFRNALLTKGGFSNENIALEEVVGAIRFDVHVEVMQDEQGKMIRFIERVTEIVPDEEKIYRLNDVVKYDYETGNYILNKISEQTLANIKKNMKQEDFRKLQMIFENVG